MQKMTGEVLRLNNSEAVYTAAGSTVLVFQSGALIANGTVNFDQQFEVELPSGTVGEIEIRLDLHGSAPVTATLEAGEVLHVSIFYNNQQQFA